LANAGIVPSSTATYTSAQIKAALKASFGYDVTIQCASGALDEIWYSFDVQGSVQTGTFLPAAPVGQSASCASTGIKYLPKSGSAATTTLVTSTKTATTSAAGSTGTTVSGTFSGTGYLNAITSGSQDGCLISAGTWYTTGTCATYTATASGELKTYWKFNTEIV
jgi:ribonuclease T2